MQDGDYPIQEETEWELEQSLEPESAMPIDFSYYYELEDTNPYQGSYRWDEMSYNHERTDWDDACEETEWELFLKENIL